MKKLIILIFLISTLAACTGEGNNEQENTDTTITTTTVPTDPCADAAVIEKIKEAISVGKITGMTDEEEQEWLAKKEKLQPGETGIESYSVDTLFFQHCILSVDAFAESMGAYPDGWHTYLNFDMRTGDSLHLPDILNNATLPEFIRLANVKLERNIEDARKTLTGQDLETFNLAWDERETGRKFTTDNIGQYLIKDNSLILIFPFEFPHVIRALEPDGHITFTAEELQPFLKKDGLLGYWVK